jgi:hypothetical protein
MRRHQLPIIVQLLRMTGAHDAERRLPAHRHLAHDGVQRVAGIARLRLHRFRARVEDQRWLRQHRDQGEHEEDRRRDEQHAAGVSHRPPHVAFHGAEHPVAVQRPARARDEQEEDREHEKPREKDADRDQDAELGKARRVAQEQREKADRRGERAEEDRAAEISNRLVDSCGVVEAVVACLLVATEDEDREVDAEADEDRAEADRHHVQLAEYQQPDRQRHDTAE